MNVGIDLGTTNTLVCVNIKGKEKCLRFGEMDSEMLPSAIYYVEDTDEVMVGADAKDEGIIDPFNFIKSAKTYMGDNQHIYHCKGRDFNPTQVATEVLKEVKKTIVQELDLDEDERIDAVITVPAYFNTDQRRETRQAGFDAGLNVTRIIAEPTAAAVAFIDNEEIEGKVFVIDLGGGTFDLSVMEQDDKDIYKACRAAGGDNHLGGDDFDLMLEEYLISVFKEDTGIDLTSYEKSGIPDKRKYYSVRGKIRNEAELAKIKLSKKNEAKIILKNLVSKDGKSDLNINLTREDFEECCQSLFSKIETMIRDYIKTENIDISEIEEVVLVGGSCYIPKVREIVESIFNKKANASMDLSTLVVKGACIVSESESGVGDSNFVDMVAHSLGVEVKGKKFVKMLERGTRIGANDKVIGKNTFLTSRDNQDSIDVRVYECQGDENEKDVRKLKRYGRFVMSGLKKRPAEKTEIEITFEYDKDGVLVVNAIDTADPNASISVSLDGSSWEEDNSSGEPIDFVLLLDTSGSMNQDEKFQGEKSTKLNIAKFACKELVENMIDFTNHSLEVLTFDSSVTKISDRSTDKRDLAHKIHGIPGSNGLTEIAMALDSAKSDLIISKKEKVILIVTDGNPVTNCNITSEKYYEICVSKANDCKNNNIRIIIIGVGILDEYTELMKRIASKKEDGGTDYYSISNFNQLAETFKTVMRDIIEK